MTSKIRTQARDAVIAAEQWAATVEMEREVAQAEAAELRAVIERLTRPTISVGFGGGCYMNVVEADQ